MSEETITIRRKEYEELSKNSEELQVLRKKNEEPTLQIQFFGKKLTRHKSIASGGKNKVNISEETVYACLGAGILKNLKILK